MGNRFRSRSFPHVSRCPGLLVALGMDFFSLNPWAKNIFSPRIQERSSIFSRPFLLLNFNHLALPSDAEKHGATSPNSYTNQRKTSPSGCQ